MGIGVNQQILMVTEDQLRDFAIEVAEIVIGKRKERVVSERFDPDKYVRGIKGIRELFGVSHTMAQHYKNTFLQPAVTQIGRKIYTDREKALMLFEKYKRAN